MKIKVQELSAYSVVIGRFHRLFGLALLSLLLSGCKTTMQKAEFAPYAGHSAYGNMTEGQLYEGQRLFLNRCSSCHALVEAKEHSYAEWVKIIPEMAEDAKLDNEDEAMVLAYLRTRLKG